MKLRTNKESRELLDEIREKRLWEDYTDMRKVLGIMNNGEDEPWEQQFVVSRLVPNDRNFNVLKRFKTEKAAKKYDEKIRRCLAGEIEITVKCGWRRDKLSDMFWVGSTELLFGKNNVVLVLHLSREMAQFLLGTWEPMISWADDLAERLKAEENGR